MTIPTHDHPLKLPGIATVVLHHPNAVKGITISIALAGIALIFAAIATNTMGLSPLSVVIVEGSTGGLLTLVGGALQIPRVLITPQRAKYHNRFTYVKGGTEIGRMRHDGKMPVLEVNYGDGTSKDFRAAGRAQAYITASQIHHLRGLMRKKVRLDYSVLFKPSHPEIPTCFPKMLDATKASLKAQSPELLAELKGGVEGYNQWLRVKFCALTRPPDLTLDEALWLHLEPDTFHLDKNGAESNSPDVSGPACTSLLARDGRRDRVLLGRNLDWAGGAPLGMHTLTIVRKFNPNAPFKSSVEIGLPGFVGTLTGVNSEQVAVSMNVCSVNDEDEQTGTIGGLPAALYNRKLLMECDDEASIRTQLQTDPLGSYHLTIKHRTGGMIVHFKQLDYVRVTLLRPLAATVGAAEAVCNETYENDSGANAALKAQAERLDGIPVPISMKPGHNLFEAMHRRQHHIDPLLATTTTATSTTQRVRAVLQDTCVNNGLTIQSVIIGTDTLHVTSGAGLAATLPTWKGSVRKLLNVSFASGLPR